MYPLTIKKNHFIEVSLVDNEVLLLYNEVFYNEAFLYMCNSFSYSLPLLLLQGIEYSSLCYTINYPNSGKIIYITLRNYLTPMLSLCGSGADSTVGLREEHVIQVWLHLPWPQQLVQKWAQLI